MSDERGWTASSPAFAEVCVLALWLGGALFFTAVAAPAAFAVLPTPTLAGALVGRLLPPLYASGMAVGFLVLALEVRWRRAWGRARMVAGAVILAACLAGQFVIGRRIERLRAESRSPISALAAADPRRVAFGRLHALSVAALGAAILAAGVAVLTAARTPPTTGA